MNAWKVCLVIAVVGGVGAMALCCYVGLALVSLSSTSREDAGPLATLQTDLDIELPIDEASSLIIDGPSILRKRISAVEDLLGQPTKIWYPGEAGSPLTASESGQWRVYQVGRYLIDVRFGADNRSHELYLGVSELDLERECYPLQLPNALQLLARMGIPTDLLNRTPDQQFYTDSGIPWAWQWDDLGGYDIFLLANPETGHVWQVKISR